ncbi:sister-chromatid cohesion protein 3 [Tanacetum coccineum]
MSVKTLGIQMFLSQVSHSSYEIKSEAYISHQRNIVFHNWQAKEQEKKRRDVDSTNTLHNGHEREVISKPLDERLKTHSKIPKPTPNDHTSEEEEYHEHVKEGAEIVLQDHILRDSSICVMDDDSVSAFVCLRDTIPSFDLSCFTNKDNAPSKAQQTLVDALFSEVVFDCVSGSSPRPDTPTYVLCVSSTGRTLLFYCLLTINRYLQDCVKSWDIWLFVHHYKDIDPDIRMPCIQSLGAWIVSYPSLFLQDFAGVRKASILALQDVYDMDDNVPFLGPFSHQVLSLYLIDDIWEFMDAMQDWERITSMLLYENPSIELRDDDAANLTLLFCASVKKAVGERIVPAIDHRKPYNTKAQKLEDMFAACGTIKCVSMPKRSRYGFVYFTSRESIISAMRLHGEKLHPIWVGLNEEAVQFYHFRAHFSISFQY